MLLLLAMLWASTGQAAPQGEPRARLVKRGARAWENVTPEQTGDLAGKGLTRLMIHAIADRSFLDMLTPIKSFLYDCKLRGLRLDSTDEIDWAMACYMDDLCYVRHMNFNHASKLYSGFCHLSPEFRDRLPRAARALIGWQRLSNAAEGGPLPREALGLIMKYFLNNNQALPALVVLLSFDAYLRESDWETLTTDDVSIVQTNKKETPQVALLLGSGKRGLSTKTGSDQGVVLDDPLLRAWMAAMVTDLPAKAALFPFTQIEFRRWWHEACQQTGVGHTPPHSLRHSGPAEAVLLKTKSLEEIRRRGRWQSLKSVQRYTKSHVLLARLGLLSQKQRAEGTAFWKELPQNSCPDKHLQAAIVDMRNRPARQARKPQSSKMEAGEGLA